MEQLLPCDFVLTNHAIQETTKKTVYPFENGILFNIRHSNTVSRPWPGRGIEVELDSGYSIKILKTAASSKLPEEFKSQESSSEKAEEDECKTAKEEQLTQVITIQDNNGKSCVMDVWPTEEVSELMHNIHRWSGVAPVNQRLLYEGYRFLWT